MNGAPASERPKPGGPPRAGGFAFWFPLAAAALLLAVANGRDTIPAAAWLAPVFLLRFARGGGRLRLAGAWLLLTATWALQFRGMVPAPQPLLAAIWIAYGSAAFLPYVADRLLARRLPPLASTLVFPCAAAAVDYLVSLLPYGSWASPAYTQSGDLSLTQLAAVTGIYGITFLMAWAAAVANLAWERRGDLRSVGLPAAGFASVLAAVLLLGGARLLAPRPAATVRIAGLTAPDIQPYPDRDVARRTFAGTLTAAERADVRRRSQEIDDDLLRRAARAAAAGARVVFWAEANSFVLEEDEPGFLAKASGVARETGIYLGLGHAVIHPGREKPLENTFILLGPDGKVQWRYVKAHPVPGGEAAVSERGDGRLPFATTPFGRLSAVICFDADSVQLLHQAGAGGADILLVPANDWPAIAVRHAEMAAFRGVEQGSSTVREASGGLCLATDSRGRTLTAVGGEPGRAGGDLVAEVPTRGVTTVYSRVGDLFSWLVLAGLAGLAAAALRRSSLR